MDEKIIYLGPYFVYNALEPIEDRRIQIHKQNPSYFFPGIKSWQMLPAFHEES